MTGRTSSTSSPPTTASLVSSSLSRMTSTVLVIRGDELLTGDTVVGDDDVLEVRPVMSGGGA